MPLSPKQRVIIDAIQQNGQITKKEAVRVTLGAGLGNYANTSKYVGETLSRMVKTRMIKRVSRGVYEIGSMVQAGKENNNPNQSSLF